MRHFLKKFTLLGMAGMLTIAQAQEALPSLASSDDSIGRERSDSGNSYSGCLAALGPVLEEAKEDAHENEGGVPLLSSVPFLAPTLAHSLEANPDLWLAKYEEFMARTSVGQTCTNAAILEAIGAATQPFRDRVVDEKLAYREQLAAGLTKTAPFLTPIGYTELALPDGDLAADALKRIISASYAAILHVNALTIGEAKKVAAVLDLARLETAAMRLDALHKMLPTPDVTLGGYIKALVRNKFSPMQASSWGDRVDISKPDARIFGEAITAALPSYFSVLKDTLALPEMIYAQWHEIEEIMGRHEYCGYRSALDISFSRPLAEREGVYLFQAMHSGIMISEKEESRESIARQAIAAAEFHAQLKSLKESILAIRPVMADLVTFIA